MKSVTMETCVFGFTAQSLGTLVIDVEREVEVGLVPDLL